ncbi:hypothetical protein GGX14DRAFT_427424 [Mycena pura]|uniref:Uncharacterized protein n=1 Tax=Mycena pura TaxID=153505 RepID=A0AAD6YME0_9AGAR|nr:hypothetical protein GGX14DRAFT_427424 [Mycena pura]
MNNTAPTEYIVDLDVFDSSWRSLVLELSGAGATILLYGIYVVLFAIAVPTLARRKAPSNSIFRAVCGVTFVFSTTQTILCFAASAVYIQMVQKVVTEETNLNPSPGPSQAPIKLYRVFSALNAAELIVFIYRCYMLWGSQKKVIVLPGILMLGTVAGRIWQKRREASYLDVNDGFKDRYNTVIAIILESGALYCICAVAVIIGSSILDGYNMLYFVALGMAKQAVVSSSSYSINLVPVLIVVRVGLGHDIHATIQSRNDYPPTYAKRGLARPSEQQTPEMDIAPGVLHIKPVEEEV